MGNLGSIPGEENGYPLQYSGLENPMDYPWDCKELDMTEQLSFHFTSLPTQEWNLGLLRLQADSLLSEPPGKHACMNAKLLQLCPTLCDPMDNSLLGSSVRGILQARILEWVSRPSSRGSSQPRDGNCISYISCICRWVLYH